MNRILVATDGSEGADRAVDYAARRAKADGAELLIVNVISGYGLPDKIFMAFTHDQQIWLKEMLESQSAQTLTAARDRARKPGVGTILLEFADRRSRANDHRDCTGNEGGRHRRRQTWRWACCRTVARQRLAEARGSFAFAVDRHPVS